MKSISFLLILCTVFLFSCGSNNDDDTTPVNNPPQQEERPPSTSFNTRLNNNLAISGNKCEGNETTEYGGKTYTCEKDEWLVVVDNLNTCSDDGICTEIAPIPIVADLDDVESRTDNEYRYFSIDPESPVTARQRQILRSVLVRWNQSGESEVIYK